jgi:hypothetical protein
MPGSPDKLRARIAAYPWPPQRSGVEVVRANKGDTLYSRRTGGPVARLRPTGSSDKVQPGFPVWPALCWRESARFGLISSSLRHLRWWLHGTPSG